MKQHDEQPARLPAHLERLSHWMDKAIPVPGTNWRFGLDGLLGLVPGVGDVAGLLISTWIIISSGRVGASRATLLRMAFNVGRDALIGTVPVIGDLYDIHSKANVRNIELLRADLEAQRREQPSSRSTVLLLIIISALLAVLGLAIYGAVVLLQGA